MKSELTADKVLMRGPKADGSFQITFEIGEYQIQALAQLLAKLKTDQIVKLTIEQNENER